MVEPDPERVRLLRETSLLRAGFPAATAAELAARADLELRDALGLVKAGFPPEVAAGLLRSGQRPVF